MRSSTTPTAEQTADLDRRSLAYDQELTEKGHSSSPRPSRAATAPCWSACASGKVSTTDGPYIETKEQMAGFILIEARDMNEAVRLAAGIPLAEIGHHRGAARLHHPRPPPL